MTQGLTGLKRIQIAKENTLGTFVTPTIALIGKLTAKPNYSIYRPDDVETGLLSSYNRSEIVGQQAELTFESDFNFEQGMYLLGMAVNGGVTADTNHVWNYSPVLNSSWQPDTYSFLYGDNAQVYKSTMVFAKDLTISGSIDDAVMVSANLYGQTMSKSSIAFQSLTVPSLECAKTNLGRVYIDTSWSGLGTTEIPASVIDFSYKITEGAEAIKFLNGQLYSSAITEKKRHVELELTLAHNEVYSGTLFPAYLAQDKVFIRLSFNGSGTKNLTLDGCYVLDNPDSFTDSNGQNTVKVKLVSVYDTTSSSEWAISLTSE